MQLLILLTFLYSLPALSHQSSVTSSQNKIKWNYSNVPLRIISNSNSLPGSSTSIIEQSIAEWNAASSFKIQKVSTGTNQIQFTNNFSIYGSAVVGVTEVNYATSGIINSATILLNEENYNFVSTPGMAFGNSIYLKDVVTHELGHFVGLSHSEVLNSSMFYQTFPGQSEISADDKAGIRSKYTSGYGKISGYVQGGNHIGILGVHVQAISRKTGEAIAGITDERGYFDISGLDTNDSYYIYTSNIKNLNALPSYFSSVQTEFCPAAYASSFFSQCGRENDGLPQSITLSTSQPSVNVGVISISCSLRIQESYVYEKIQSQFSSLEIFNYSLNPRVEKSYVGFFNPSDLNTTSFNGNDILKIDLSGYTSPFNKWLKIKLISQPLGSAVEYSMTVRNGSTVYAGPLGKTLNSEGTYKLDLSTSIALSSTVNSNIFEVEIQAKILSSVVAGYSIPDFAKFGSVTSQPYLLVMSLEDVAGPLLDTGSILSDNQSCLDAPFTYAVTKSLARNDEGISSGAQAGAVASCGSIDPPSGPGSGPGQFMIILTLGFLLSVLPSKLAKRNKNILS
jgi:predicted Zn-dependent protease